VPERERKIVQEMKNEGENEIVRVRVGDAKVTKIKEELIESHYDNSITYCITTIL
jgi:hypothetical protein